MECNEIQRILQVYETSFGQQLNRSKTSLFFSPNTDMSTKESIKAMFGAQVIRAHESYLGLPSLVGKSKRNTFAQLKQRVANKVSGWKEKLLSSAGKEVLIKAVAQVVPSYTMSCFKLPNKLCDELTGLVRQFWWGLVRDEKKLAWMSWEKMFSKLEWGYISETILVDKMITINMSVEDDTHVLFILCLAAKWGGFSHEDFS
ncbi:uncharacterized protein LOC112013903 [Quercus suber]|uniref:uncharacterized protein LOC112013903 n=1 Tax=Quercus suber TaxID=58331 RepID=UPI000CE28291|nr:uncharacterized protein LOC112013903 [Quercus suber]